MIIKADRPRILQRLREIEFNRKWLVVTMLIGVAAMVGFGLGFVGGRKGLRATAGEIISESKLLVWQGWHRAISPQIEHIDIDVGFEEWSRIAAKREEALARNILLTGDDDFVNGEANYKGEMIPVKLRLKGDWVDHIQGDKWSLRIHTRNDQALMGMKRFSIQDPSTRRHANEWVFMRALRKEGLIGLRYEFVDVSINGEHKGIYALEEHFSKELVENNQRREGPILKFGEDGFWTNRSVFGHAPGMDQGYYYRSGVEVFRENRTLGDEVLGGEFLEAKRMLELYRLGELKGRQVFDVDQWASLWALADVFGVRHGLVWHGLRFYYNPITGLMEPIAFDVEAGNVINNLAIDLDPGEYEFLGLLSDREFQEAYVRKLGEYSNERWVVSFFEEVGGELGVVVRTINRDEKYTFDRGVVERNALWVRNKLNQENVVRAVVDEAGDLMVWSLSELPLEVLAVVNSSGDEMVGLNDPVVVGGASRFESRAGERIWGVGESGEIEGMRVLWRYLGMGKVREALVSPVVVSANDKRLDRSPALPHFVWFDRARNSYVIPGGKWVMDRDLVTPEGLGLIVSPGARLDLMSGAAIIVQGPLQARGGEGDVIKIGSSDGTGEGLVVLNAKKKSVLSFVEFTNLKSVSNQANNITGAVTFYQSPTLIDHCLFEGIEAEDMLNIIGAEFEITNSSFVDASSDAVDIDFGQGEIRATSFSNLTNDGLDVSGSIVEIAGVNIAGAGDKGISVGEASRVRIEHSEMVESRTGVASKDGSSVEMFSSNISGSEIGVSVYRKKSEYGPSGIALWDVELVGNQDDWLVEEKMELLVNGKEVNEKEVGVYEKYYRE